MPLPVWNPSGSFHSLSAVENGRFNPVQVSNHLITTPASITVFPPTAKPVQGSRHQFLFKISFIFFFCLEAFDVECTCTGIVVSSELGLLLSDVCSEMVR